MKGRLSRLPGVFQIPARLDFSCFAIPHPLRMRILVRADDATASLGLLARAPDPVFDSESCNLSI